MLEMFCAGLRIFDNDAYGLLPLAPLGLDVADSANSFLEYRILKCRLKSGNLFPRVLISLFGRSLCVVI